MAGRNIKLPLQARGFPYLCNFIRLLGVDLAALRTAESANETAFNALAAEVRAGEVAAPLDTASGVSLATRGSVEIQAVRIL